MRRAAPVWLGAASRTRTTRSHTRGRRTFPLSADPANHADGTHCIVTDEVVEVLDSDDFSDEVRAEEREASELGCTGVPLFVIDRAFAVPGAQDSETFLVTLRRAWERNHPVEMVTAAQVKAPSCDGDACEI